MKNRSGNAFTLVEMLVVTGMLTILMGVAFSGLGQARAQARVAKANTEIRELVNAILSYEAENEELDIASAPKDATASNIGKLLGGGTDKVYLNAPVVNGAFRDPWGTPYRYRVVEGRVDEGNRTTVSAAVTFPNRHRDVRW